MIGRIMAYYENPDSTVVTGAILPVTYENNFKSACAATLFRWGESEALKAFEDEYGLEDGDYDSREYEKEFRDYQCRSECSYEVLEDGT